MAFNKWDVDQQQPNNKGKDGVPEHYLVMKIDRNGLWFDTTGYQRPGWETGFVCQWDAGKTTDRDQSQFQKMQGTWAVESNIANGKPSPQGQEKWTITYSGDAFAVRRDGELITSGTWSIDPDKLPMEYTQTATEGQGAGNVRLGIIRWDGQAMLRCEGSSRPDKFEASKGQQRTLHRLVKVR